MLMLLGQDVALLEGIAQTLSVAGPRVVVAHSVEEAAEAASRQAPLLLVVDRALAAGDRRDAVGSLPLASGGAIVLYRGTGSAVGALTLPRLMARTTLADLTLPLERQRLVALAQYVRTRARESGRVRFDTPPERHISSDGPRGGDAAGR
jgi:DNA-binding NtrC family response regulator